MAYVVDESNTNPPWSISGPPIFFCAPGPPSAFMDRNATGLASDRAGDRSERPHATSSRASRSTADCDRRPRTAIVVIRPIDIEDLRAMDGGAPSGALFLPSIQASRR